jgi:hypothetical protein
MRLCENVPVQLERRIQFSEDAAASVLFSKASSVQAKSETLFPKFPTPVSFHTASYRLVEPRGSDHSTS